MSLLHPSPLKNKKTCLPVAGWSGVASGLQAGLAATSKAASGQAACCYWSGELAPQRPFPPAVPAQQAGRAGRSPGLQAAEPPVTTRGNNGLEGLEGAHQSSPCLSQAPPATGTGCCEVCFLPVLFPPCWAHCLPPRSQGKQWPQETSLGCCWGSTALEYEAGGGDHRRTSIAQVPFCLGL